MFSTPPLLKKLYMDPLNSEKNFLHPPTFFLCGTSLESTLVINRKLRLTSPHRIEVIREHREWEGRAFQAKNYPNLNLMPSTHKSRVKQQTAKSLIGFETNFNTRNESSNRSCL